MAKLYINQISQVPSNRDNWENTYDNLRPLLERAPQIQSGAVNIEVAEKWLSASSKVLTEAEVNRQLSRKFGFGSHEIRALWAHDQGEYYPNLGAIEIYADKNFLTVDIPNEKDIGELLRTKIGQMILAAKYGVNRDISVENTLQKPFKADLEWAISRPALAGKLENNNIIIDIKHNQNEQVTQSDTLRLHHHAIVAEAAKEQVSAIYQANLVIPDHVLSVIQTMAMLGKDQTHYFNAIDAAVAMEAEGREISLNLNRVDFSKELFSQVVKTGEAHWKNLLNGIEPHFNSNKSITMSDQDKAEYIDISQRITALTAAKNHVEEKLNDQKSLMISLSNRIGLNDNFELPYKGTTIRLNKKLDLDSLGGLLKQMFQIPSEQIQLKEFDNLAIEKQARQGEPFNINDFATYKGYDKQKVLSIAKDLGLNTEEFYSPKMTIYASGQTRGPIADAISRLKSEAVKSLDPVLSNLQNSKNLIAPALMGVDPRVKQDQEIKSSRTMNMGL